MNNYDLVFANIYGLKMKLKCSISYYTCMDFFLLECMQLLVVLLLAFGRVLSSNVLCVSEVLKLFK